MIECCRDQADITYQHIGLHRLGTIAPLDEPCIKAPSLEALMLQWLKGTYGDTAAAKAAGTGPAVAIDNAGIKTTGEKYGEPTKAPTTTPPAGPVDLDE